MRLATIAVILVALLSTQMACTSPKYTWHTVEPDALDRLTSSPEDARASAGGEVFVDCAARQRDPDQSGTRWRPPCTQIAVTGQHRLRLYRQYQEPLSVRLSQITTDDDYVYSFVSRRHEPILREIVDEDVTRFPA